VRAFLYRQLFPRGWFHAGLSPANKILFAAILIAVTIAILETEPTLNRDPVLAEIFRAGDWLFALLFSAEYLARVWAAGEEPRYAEWRGRLRYMRQPFPLIDLIAIIPFFISLGTNDAFVVRLARLLRILTLARLGEFSEAAMLMGRALAVRRFELLLSFSMAMGVLIIAATLLHMMEAEAQPAAFGSIPRAMWWSVVTLATVGYGDVYPTTVMGKIVGGITAISAVVLIAMPTGMLAAAFSEVFQAHAKRMREDDDPPPPTGPPS